MRDHRGRSPAPRPVSETLTELLGEIAPQTPLADAQSAWPTAVGEQLSAVTRVVDEKSGTLIVECQSAVWSQELALMEPRLRAVLGQAMAGEPPREIRFRTVS